MGDAMIEQRGAGLTDPSVTVRNNSVISSIIVGDQQLIDHKTRERKEN